MKRKKFVKRDGKLAAFMIEGIISFKFVEILFHFGCK